MQKLSDEIKKELKCHDITNFDFTTMVWLLPKIEQLEKNNELLKQQNKNCVSCKYNDICDKQLLFDLDNLHETKTITYCSEWKEKL